jgi:hypothetical protein
MPNTRKALCLLAGAALALVATAPSFGSGERIGRTTDATPPVNDPPVLAADAFVDSEGINTQFSRITYSRDPSLAARIKELRIRHLRDGIELRNPQSVSLFNRVANVTGAKYDFITDGGRNAFGKNAQTAADIAAFVRSVPSTEAIEAPNEYDTRCCAWQVALAAFLPTLREANVGLPIVGPAFTSQYAYDLAGDLSKFVDISNVHNYFSGFMPETDGWGGRMSVCGASHHDYCGRYGSLQYSMSLAKISGPSSDVYSTETGYGTDRAHNVVDAATQAKYIPRLLFNQFANGVKRTYLFQLVDYHAAKIGGYASYGLLEASPDYTSHVPKPSFTVLAKINALLEDPGGAFAPTPLAIRTAGTTPATQSVLLEKRDGTYYDALWSAVSSYDVNGFAPGPTPSTAQTVTLHFDVPMAATIYAFADDGTETVTRAKPGRSLDVVVSDRVTLVRIRRS